MNLINKRNAVLLLKAGVGFALLYPAFSAFANPELWIGYVPQWIEVILPRDIFLPMFSVVEIVVALAVLFTNMMFPALTATTIWIFVVAFNSAEFFVVFRDIPIAFMALALAFLLKEK